MTNLLVPIDFSEHASNALEVAAIIAQQQNATITVIHMLGLSEAVLAKNEIQEQEEANYYLKLAKKRFKPFLDNPYLKGIRINKIVQNYKNFNELNTIAHEEHSDLIVMGSHGTSGFNEFFFGSNTEKVVRSANIPVLIIKNPNPNFKVEKILFACSFQDDAIAGLKKIKGFAEIFSAKLKLIYVNTPDNFLSMLEVQDKISKFLFKAMEADQMVDIYNDYSVEQGLINYSRKEKIDIMAIATHGRKGISNFLIGSIGENLANHADYPILTVKL